MGKIAIRCLLSAVCCFGAYAADRGAARMRSAAILPTETAAQVQARAAAPVVMPIAPAKNVVNRAPVQIARSATAKSPAKANTRIAHKVPSVPTKNVQKQAVVSRAAIQTNTALLGDGYTACRDAYFTCMDQFCALRNEQYRRCTCSARLSEMRERERNFSTATTMLKDFEDNNLAVIDKTTTEVRAMYSESEGEAAITEDKTASAKALSGISEVLSGKDKDSAESMGDMASIWGTADFVGGADVASLESTALYNAVHAQCSEMVVGVCERAATFNMVSAAYGMYIEQDCTAYATGLDKQQKTMAQTTKQAKGALAAARLDNYDAHNSDAINACLANVRQEMYGAAGCGENNEKCVDYTGRFISPMTGEVIYSPDLFMLETAISLSGDTLQNNKNVPYLNLLNGKKTAASKALDKCRDIADLVWDEYLRQTLIDLSQKQIDKVREVRNSCVKVVNDCYDEKLDQLRQFASDQQQDNVNASQIAMTEQLCQTKLDACAIVYGGGPPGLAKLRDYVRNTQTTKLENDCEQYLTEYAATTCTPINDNVHGYPYECRFYAPGTQKDGLVDNVIEIIGGAMSLYGNLRSKAGEVCTRPDANGALTNEVEMIISKIMDDVKLKMDETLAAECEKVDGVWHSKTLSTWPNTTDNDKFKNNIAANDGWGACEAAPETP